MRTRANFGVTGPLQDATATTVSVFNSVDQESLASQNQWPKPVTLEVLLVAGGGGGSSRHRGGGGAGGVIYQTNIPAIGGKFFGTTTYTVTVGAGGAGATQNLSVGPNYGSYGADSTFMGMRAVGGGSYYVDHAVAGVQYNQSMYDGGYLAGGIAGGWNGSGGSGCGSCATGAATYDLVGAGYNVVGQGNPGGYGSTGAVSEGYYTGGGGGGAGAKGGNAISGSSATPGNGGIGIANPISGSTTGQLVTSTYYIAGGGGGGGNATANKASTGGTGGGGNGSANGAGVAGTANTGGGGGGGGFGGNSSYAGGNGGSGVVIIRYPASYGAPTSTTGSPTISVVNNYYICTFTSSGTILF